MNLNISFIKATNDIKIIALLVYIMNVDIVNLIELNPITNLNGNYQSKIVEKVKNNFSTYEQQMFVASFYCYLNYNKKTDFVIDLDNVWKWLGFTQKVTSKKLLEKHFVIDKDYKISALGETKAVLCDEKKNGGQNKEIIMLNIETFKKFCMKAGTKKADEIHDYYLKLEEILHEYHQEECDELKMQLQQKNAEIHTLEETKEKEYKLKLERQQLLERENVLLNQYASAGSIVYIIRVKTFKNGEYIIKIGESRIGVLNRYNEHKSKFEECLLLDCFAVNRSHDFENFLHNHEHIRGNRVQDLQNHETEMELFMIGKKLSYALLLKTIKNNIKYFDSNDTHKMELENDKLRMMLEMKKNENDNVLIVELTNIVKTLSCKVDRLEKSNNIMIERLNSTQTKVVTGFNEPLVTVGPRLQKIHPETLQLVKVYETVTECMKEDCKIKRPSIAKAVVENIVYNEYRWMYVDRNLDPNIIHNIEPTKKTKAQALGYIAQINSEKTEIVNVFIDRKTAAQFNGYESLAALDGPVKKFSLSKNFYYRLYDECDEDLKCAFEEKSGEPLLYKNGVGQFDSESMLVKTFACKYECIKHLKISDKTLAKCLSKNIQYNGFYFKEIESKLNY